VEKPVSDVDNFPFRFEQGRDGPARYSIITYAK
jgi:hypothetical protein